MRLLDIDQRSDAWLAWRACGLGSSDAAAIVGLSPWTTRDELLLEKEMALRGERARDRDNGAMARGRRLEPVARDLYEQLMGWEAPPACGVHREHDWLKASFDGWVRERSLPVEIKCPNRADHELALQGDVPEKYAAQVPHLMLVSGASRLHYVSYSDYFPTGSRLAVVTVERDERICDLLFQAELEFWREVECRLLDG